MQPGFSDSLKYYQFDLLRGAPLQHGIFTRQGGISPDPWRSLNVGGTVGDAVARVQENQQRIFNALELDPADRYEVWQVHSAQVAIADAPRGGKAYTKADVILTKRPGLSLMMRFADCVPIMLYDPVQHAIGLAHAGWLGTVRGAARAAVQGMVDEYGTQPGDIVAGIGPSIGPDHYEVGEDVYASYLQAFGGRAGAYFHGDGRKYLDLWSANLSQLEELGVTQVEVAGICTACATDEWFSHRAERGRTGRFAAVLSLLPA
jgi:hypothetical protein